MEDKTGKITQQIGRLKIAARELILAIGHDESKDELHKMSIDMLLEITELERFLTAISTEFQSETGRVDGSGYKGSGVSRNVAIEETEEIRKVERKLHRWARNQQQINSRILNLFLSLKIEGVDVVTEDRLMKKYGDYGEFDRNFSQMKMISPKNHAKVFEVRNGAVEIWEPVRQYVEEYKKTVFKTNGSYHQL